MKIKIRRLEMTNFKCFRHKELYFDGDITTIRGRNGAGKTTIADAILWCLFGKNTQGKSELDLFKTLEEGKVIPHLDHTVEMELEVEGDLPAADAAGVVAIPGGETAGHTVTLKRCVKERWEKKRGSEETVFKNNTVEYTYNGQAMNEAEYKEKVSHFIDESIFQIVTVPSYFPSLHWKVQRDVLSRLVDRNKPEFAPTDEEQEFLRRIPDGDTAEEYLVALRQRIKKAKERLAAIPVKLETANKTLPEKEDWEQVSKALDEAVDRVIDREEKILAIRQGDGAAVKRDELRAEIDDLRLRLDEAEYGVRRRVRKEQDAKERALMDASVRFNGALGNQRLMEQTIEADSRLMERCKQTIEECTRERERLIALWPKETFSYDAESTDYCPTCGQYLPEEQRREKIETMRRNFNLAHERTKKEINEKGQRNNETKAKAEEELKGYEAKLQADTEALARIKEEINEAFSAKAEIEKAPVKSFEEYLAEDAEYNALRKQTEEKQAQLATITSDSDVDKEQLTRLESERANAKEACDALRERMAMKGQYDKVTALIAEIEKEQQDLVKQLSELEREEDGIRAYQSRMNAEVEREVNKHFSLVQWRLFRTVNNGGDPHDEPYCECLVGGVAYGRGLNQAARLNAGLDIINTLSMFCGVSAPILIDNAESNLNIMATRGQQIRLAVADTELSQR